MKWPMSVTPYDCAIIPMINKNDKSNLEKSIKIFVSSGTHISSQIRKLSKAENLLSRLKLESIENLIGKITSS